MKKNNTLRITSKHHLTKPVLYTTTFLLLATCILPLTSATEPAPNIRLPDEPITMVVTDGDDSYFDIDVSDVPADLEVTNGLYKGWCADRSVIMPRGEQLTIRLYNSYDASLPWAVYDKDLGKVNDILNHHEGVSMKDIQDAFWHLLSEYPYSSLTSTAQKLVDNASNDFIPKPGEWIAILAEPLQNDSNLWPFQIAFLQVRLPSDEPTEPEEPVPTRISHGLHYNDIAPTADTNGPYTGYPKETIEFDGTASVDPDGVIISYHWAFGDGAYAEEPTTSHSYTHAGVYQISLKVTDNFGLSNTEHTDATITIQNSPPTNPVISGPVNGTTNTEYSYAFRSIDQNHDDITYRIDWGDGTPIQTTLQPSGQYFALIHQWNTPGTYTITVTASDGTLIAVSAQDIQIKELPITENIWVLGLAVLAIIALLAILLTAYKPKNKP